MDVQKTTAIYHLALLLLLHLCFNVRGGLALRRTPPPNAGAAAAGGINEPLPAAHDELWATVQLQQRRQQRQEQEEKREAEGVEMKVVAGLPPDSPSGRGRRGRGGLFQRHAAAVTAAAGGGGGVSGDGGNCTPSGGRSPHSGGVDAEEGADGAFVSKAPWTPPRTRGEIPLPSPLEAGHSPRPKEKKGDGGIDGRGRRRQRRRPWAMWELPEVTHVRTCVCVDDTCASGL